MTSFKEAGVLVEQAHQASYVVGADHGALRFCGVAGEAAERAVANDQPALRVLAPWPAPRALELRLPLRARRERGLGPLVPRVQVRLAESGLLGSLPVPMNWSRPPWWQ